MKKNEAIAEPDSLPIHWARMAEPQNDQYDTLLCLKLLHMKGYRRSDPGQEPTFFDGKVAIKNEGSPFPPQCTYAAYDHPNVQKACDLVRLWPTVFSQFQSLIESVAIFVDTQTDRNCSYMSYHKDFGRMGATINNHVAFAEALVHEMAHHKLFALGIGIESAERLIMGPLQHQFLSPIRHDLPRPMPAVFHAQYSFTYVAALLLEIIKSASIKDLERESAGKTLALTLPQLEFGGKVVWGAIELDDAGVDFMQGYQTWMNRIFEHGYKVLDLLQIAPKTFIHPLHNESRTSLNSNKESSLEKGIVTDDVGTAMCSSQEISASVAFLNMRPIIKSDIQKNALGDEALLYSRSDKVGISLNRSATMILQLCDGDRTVNDIAHELAQKFSITSEPLFAELLSDIRAAIIQLHHYGVVSQDETVGAN